MLAQVPPAQNPPNDDPNEQGANGPQGLQLSG
jgi:hypothetical protein